MKILMTADTLGGVWSYALGLSRSLLPYGVEVHLATMGAPLNENQHSEVHDIPNITLYESSYKLEWMDDPWADADEAAVWLAGICERVQPDLIHFNNYGQVDHNWRCPVVTVFHSCVLSWWRATKNSEPEEERWLYYKKRLKEALHTSDIVVAPTISILNEVQEIYGVLDHSISIYNGCEEPLFPDIHKEPIIFSMGRVWDEGKNMKVLEDLAAAVGWPVYLAGEHTDPVTGKEIQVENVHFLGKLRPGSIKEWLARSAMYVQPSIYEPFGLSVLEAARAGCALVLNDIHTFRELWKDTACFVDFNDLEKAADKVNSLIENQYLRSCLASAARHRARRYNELQMAEEYVGVYEELTRKKLKKNSDLITAKV